MSGDSKWHSEHQSNNNRSTLHILSIIKNNPRPMQFGDFYCSGFSLRIFYEMKQNTYTPVIIKNIMAHSANVVLKMYNYILNICLLQFCLDKFVHLIAFFLLIAKQWSRIKFELFIFPCF